MVIRIILPFLVLLAAASVSAQPLENFLREAMDNNPGLRGRLVEVQAALQRLPQAKALPEPEVNVSYFLGHMILPEGNQLGSISAMQMFPWPGTLRAMETEAARQASVKEQQVAVARNELAFTVRSAWYPLVALEEKIRIQRENLRILDTDKELATIKFQQGTAPMVDAIRADIMIDEVKTEILLLEQQRRPLLVAFNLLLARAAEAPISGYDTLPDPQSMPVRPVDTLWVNHPSLAVFDRQIQAAAAEEGVAATMRRPMFGLGMQYMLLRERPPSGDHVIQPNTGQDMFMAMATVRVPLWRKKYDAAVEESRLMQTMYTEMRADRRNELAAEYAMAVYELDKTRQVLMLLDQQIAKTQQAVELLIAAYSNAGQDFEEVLSLQQRLIRYRLEKVEAKTDYYLAQVKLDYLAGR